MSPPPPAAGSLCAAATEKAYEASNGRREGRESASPAYQVRAGFPHRGIRGRGSVAGTRGRRGLRATSEESGTSAPGGGGRELPTWRCQVGRGACCDEVPGPFPKFCLSDFSVTNSVGPSLVALARNSLLRRYRRRRDSIWAPRVQRLQEQIRRLHHWDVPNALEHVQRPVGPAADKLPCRCDRDQLVEASMDHQGWGANLRHLDPEPRVGHAQADRSARLKECAAVLPSEIVSLTHEPDMRLDDLGRHARRVGSDDGKGFADEPFGAEQANSTVEQDLSEP